MLGLSDLLAVDHRLVSVLDDNPSRRLVHRIDIAGIDD
jgi:hypothetical protein